MNRYILIINGTAHIINEDCISNWDEINISLKRNDFSGIIRSFSSKFEFAGKAYNLLLNEYRTNYLNANAQIEIYTIDNDKSKGISLVVIWILAHWNMMIVLSISML